MENQQHDLIIIGAGPAGLTAAIYAKRALLKTLIFEKDLAGGKLNKTAEVENYPGFSKIGGSELAIKMTEHAHEEVVELTKDEQEMFAVKTKNGTYFSKAVVIASGTVENKLKVPGEEEFTNFGVSYCAICDGFLFRGETVAVVGGGYSACEAALYLSNIAKKVYLIHRREQFRVDPEIEQQIKQNPRIKLIFNTIVSEIGGEIEKKKKKITHLILKSSQTGKENFVQEKLAVNALFPCIGLLPYTDFLHNLDVCDGKNYIVVNEKCATKIPGLLAVGDVIHPERIKQIATAAGDGAIAAQAVTEYLRKTSKN
ncbi:13374_t:CDS:2 [Entrophospora sp. SA101]|nr:15420_t:CDS:2 [Entrophospora sp. SA101]CAJ0844839.1 3801_t:CDS:2 [Entrophospora sp. SA101]CAJ0894405.1 13374_t:CDS:2 [Entrophospora sp. SA101]